VDERNEAVPSRRLNPKWSEERPQILPLLVQAHRPPFLHGFHMAGIRVPLPFQKVSIVLRHQDPPGQTRSRS
jgi:hypothetical protein